MGANDFKKGHNGCSQCNRERRSFNTSKMNSQYEMYDQSGSNNSMWNGLSPLKQYLRGQLTDWKKESMEHYDYKCTITGKPFHDNHHITSFHNIVERTMHITGLPIHDEIGKYNNDELDRIVEVFHGLHKLYGHGALMSKEIHDSYHNQVGRHDGFINIDTFIMFTKSYAHVNGIDLSKLLNELHQQKRINKLIELNYSLQSA